MCCRSQAVPTAHGSLASQPARSRTDQRPGGTLSSRDRGFWRVLSPRLSKQVPASRSGREGLQHQHLLPPPPSCAGAGCRGLSWKWELRGTESAHGAPPPQSQEQPSPTSRPHITSSSVGSWCELNSMADDKAKHQDQWGSSKPWRGQRPTVHALRGCGGAQMDDFLWLSPSQPKGLPRRLSGKKNPPANAGDLGSIPGLGRSSGEGNGNPLQYSCLENSMERGAWRAAVHRVVKSQIQLKQLSIPAHFPGS